MLLPERRLLLLLLTASTVVCVSVWHDNPAPRSTVFLDAENVESWTFLGNSTHKDHFKLLELDGNHMLVGARNVVYNISTFDLSENRQQRIEWPAALRYRENCVMKGKSEDDCQNYIRVLAKLDQERLLICGTNAYKPKCRQYMSTNGVYDLIGGDQPGEGLCPYDPDHNSTAVYADGSLYVGTVADFSGTDALLYRNGSLRTEQHDVKLLNEPNFVSSLEYKDFVFFFFRESAVEYINCGKAIYSRVGRVCKKDRGGPHRFKHQWTSFLKSRLNCSVPGEFPFYFNEIQSTSDVVKSSQGDRDLIYGVFTTPQNSIGGSAVCAFRMQDILDTFEGPFKGQDMTNANWLPVHPYKVPEPRPGSCVDNSRSLPDMTLNFVKSHSLMDEAATFTFGFPLLIKTSIRQRFTKIAVDPHVKSLDGKRYDILFIGTDDGYVLKAINANSDETEPHSIRPVIIEEIKVFHSHVPVTNLYIIGKSELKKSKLVVVSDNAIRAIPLYRCNRVTTCGGCLALQDPYCVWDKSEGECVHLHSRSWRNSRGKLQDIYGGIHPDCPGESKTTTKPYAPSSTAPPTTCACPDRTEPTPTLTDKGSVVKVDDSSGPNDPEEKFNIIVQEFPQRHPPRIDKSNVIGPKVGASTGGERIYTADKLALAVSMACIGALIIGFVLGYLCSKKCHNNDYRSTSSAYDAPVDNRLNRFSTPIVNQERFFGSTNNKTSNLDVAEKNSHGKNANPMNETKPLAKVKKIYL